MKKRVFAAAAALILALSLSACGTGGSSQSEDPNFPVTVRDADLSTAPERIVSLSPGTTEMLFDMGFGSKVVGVGAYCDYPKEEVAKRQRCGSVLQPKTDVIKGLNPDLVVTAAALSDSDLTALQQADIQVLVLSYADSLEGVKANYMDLATAVLGRTDGAAQGGEYWDRLEGMLDTAGSLSKDAETPLTAILLREMDYGMATGDTFEGELLEKAGFTNDAKRFDNWLYDKAEVAALEPEVIFADSSIKAADIKESSVYKPVKAVLNDMIMNVDMSVFERQSPRMFDTLLSMAEFAYGSADAGEASGSGSSGESASGESASGS